MNQGALGITLRPVADKLDDYFPAAVTKGKHLPHPHKEEHEKCKESCRNYFRCCLNLSRR